MQHVVYWGGPSPRCGFFVGQAILPADPLSAGPAACKAACFFGPLSRSRGGAGGSACLARVRRPAFSALFHDRSDDARRSRRLMRGLRWQAPRPGSRGNVAGPGVFT